MRTVIMVLTVLACLLLANSAFAADKYDVRQVWWGMTKNEVKKAEAQKDVKEDGEWLAYQEQILGKKCVIVYDFEPKTSKLIQVTYLFYPKSEQEADTLFSMLSKTLADKYGNLENNTKFDDGTPAQNRNAEALFKTMLSIIRNYKNERTKIILFNRFRSEQKTVAVMYTERKEAERRAALQKEETERELKEYKEKREKDIRQF